MGTSGPWFKCPSPWPVQSGECIRPVWPIPIYPATIVLVDPTTGGCVVIDIDSLVVPGVYPPEVIGTGGYIAPEVFRDHGAAFQGS